jgi:hypothetical protein
MNGLGVGQVSQSTKNVGFGMNVVHVDDLTARTVQAFTHRYLGLFNIHFCQQ